MSGTQAQIDRFKLLAAKRKGGLLTPEEEEEYRQLGRRLAQKQRKRSTRGTAALRADPLPGCDFFDDFPELYRRGVVANEQPLPAPAQVPVLPGAVHGPGQVILNDGQRLKGHVLWAPSPSVDGKGFSRRRVQAVMLATDGGVLPGSGRRLVTEDGREITGYLASDLDENFVDIVPHEGAPRGVKRLILRRDRLRTVDLWQHGS